MNMVIKIMSWLLVITFTIGIILITAFSVSALAYECSLSISDAKIKREYGEINKITLILIEIWNITLIILPIIAFLLALGFAIFWL